MRLAVPTIGNDQLPVDDPRERLRTMAAAVQVQLAALFAQSRKGAHAGPLQART